MLISDRADTLAIAQRRELANQIPPIARVPQPEPRCHVPDWWHNRRNDLVDAIVAARRDLDAMESAQRERAGLTAAARHDVDQAEVALQPYRAERQDLVERLTQAEATKRRAEDSLSASGIFERRSCRARLVEVIAGVESVGAALEERWKPRRDAAYWTNCRLRDVAESHQLQDRLDQTRRLPERLAALTNHLDAFDTWHDWARDGHVTVKSATRMVEVLDLPADGQYKALAEAVRRLSPHMVVEHEPTHVEFGIEYPEADFGIDL